MSVLDKIARMKSRTSERISFASHRDIFHSFAEGDNIIRLVGEFLEVHTHFIAPVAKRNDRGLCQARFFQGDNRLPQTVNCINWNLDLEELKSFKDRRCPFCKLNEIARKASRELRDSTDAEDKKEREYFDALGKASYSRTGLKWHLIDRNSPWILKVVDGKEEKVKGLKIGTIGTELWKDINGIFDQCGFDITDDEDGIDICVTKTSGQKTSYAGKAVLFGKPLSVKVTPLTDEERAYDRYDLQAICGKQTDLQMMLDALHEDLKEVLDANGGEPSEPCNEEDPDPAPPPPSSRRTPATVGRKNIKSDDDDVLGSDEDVLEGVGSKKK